MRRIVKFEVPINIKKEKNTIINFSSININKKSHEKGLFQYCYHYKLIIILLPNYIDLYFLI